MDKRDVKNSSIKRGAQTEERQQESAVLQAKIARHRFAHGKALCCFFCRYIKFNKSVLIKTLKLLYKILV